MSTDVQFTDNGIQTAANFTAPSDGTLDIRADYRTSPTNEDYKDKLDPNAPRMSLIGMINNAVAFSEQDAAWSHGDVKPMVWDTSVKLKKDENILINTERSNLNAEPSQPFQHVLTFREG